MTIRDGLLEETTKALNGEDFKIIDFFGVSGSTVEEPVDSAEFPGQIGNRIATSRSRSGNQITLNAVRLTVDVVDTVDGDVIEQVGTMFDSTGDGTATSTLVNSITHTIAFDLELIAELTIDRQ